MTTLANWSVWGVPISRETAAAILMLFCGAPLVCPFRPRRARAHCRHARATPAPAPTGHSPRHALSRGRTDVVLMCANLDDDQRARHYAHR